jgi:hypothetical protein
MSKEPCRPVNTEVGLRSNSSRAGNEFVPIRFLREFAGLPTEKNAWASNEPQGCGEVCHHFLFAEHSGVTMDTPDFTTTLVEQEHICRETRFSRNEYKISTGFQLRVIQGIERLTPAVVT